LGKISEIGSDKEMGGVGENTKKSFNPSTEKKVRNPMVKIKTFMNEWIENG
jgi:hypothetical protein